MKTILKLSLLLLAIACSNACTSEIDETNSVDDMNSHTCTMLLDGGRMEFDSGINESRAVGSNWSNGDVLYIVFTRANGTTTYGTATFRASNGTWDVTYNESLARDKSTSCKVYYFDGNYDIVASTARLSENNGVYSDTNASYLYPQNGNLTITSVLKPSTSRLRFKGSVGDVLYISGLKFYSEYSIGKSTLSMSENVTILSTVGSNGYTPYIYGIFDNVSEPTLTISYESLTFSANCAGQSMLIVGKSGWMNIPTEYSHNGWTLTRANGTLNGHEYVDLGLTSGNLWATCNVGANNPEDKGNTYLWGETTPFGGLYNSYKYGVEIDHNIKFTKYCNDYNKGYNGYSDGKSTLDFSDDAAYVNWGASWRMPSKEDVIELIEECNCLNTSRNGIKGTMFVSKKNQSSIFMPWATDWTTYFTNSLYLPSCNYACDLELASSGPLCVLYRRDREAYIRPIVSK